MDNAVFQSDAFTSINLFQSIVIYIFIQFSKTHFFFPTKPLSSYSFFSRHKACNKAILVTHIMVVCTWLRHGVILLSNGTMVPACRRLHSWRCPWRWGQKETYFWNVYKSNVRGSSHPKNRQEAWSIIVCMEPVEEWRTSHGPCCSSCSGSMAHLGSWPLQ